MQGHAERDEVLTAVSFGEIKKTVRRVAEKLATVHVGTILVEEGFLGFNLVFHRDRYVAIAQQVGPLDLNAVEDVSLNRYAQQDEMFSTASLHELKKIVRRVHDKALGTRTEVHLVEEGVSGFNLVSYKGRYYAFAQRLGAVDLRPIIENAFHRYEQRKDGLAAPTLVELNDLVRRAANRSHRPDGRSAVCIVSLVRSLIGRVTKGRQRFMSVSASATVAGDGQSRDPLRDESQ